ncbi:Phosphodiesterase [Paragonimus skrjabini miyazakii]|uniref:3',5'-cyclic-AMP phosphodiesterase n=1 Tax=Paragonimus skrjabini miyazakii TaxID=59628 RepID=A0A8S9Z4G6_9TREM|nr:Phosphodiesterase [Paragonimus skrjabini miyazakii]
MMIKDNSSEDMGSASRQRPTSRLASYRPYLNSQQRQKSHDEYAISGYRNFHNHWQPQDGDLRVIAQMSKVHLRRFHKANACFPPVFTQSFDAEHRSSTESQSVGGATGVGGEGRWSNLVLHHIPDRRASFLYRHESDDNPSVYSSRHASITGEEAQFDIQPRLSTLGHVDEPIVTPFAQILASLRRVRSNFIILTNVSSSKDSRFGTCHTNLGDDLPPMLAGSYDHLKSTASETLEELEWCLERLENIQTHRSVSDMATSKFRKMLSKELSQITEGGQSSKQISEYICSTFLEPKEGDTGGGLTQGYDSGTEDKAIVTGNEQPATNISGTLDTSTECDSSSDRHNHLHTVRSSTGSIAPANIKESPATLGSQSKTVDGSDAVSSIPSYLISYGVKSDQPQKLQRLIANDLDLWGLDIFELAQVTPNPLTCVFCSILQKRGLIKRFSISEMNLVRYMNVLEENYHNVPYHNRVHAADVVQSTHVLLNAQALTVSRCTFMRYIPVHTETYMLINTHEDIIIVFLWKHFNSV